MRVKLRWRWLFQRKRRTQTTDEWTMKRLAMFLFVTLLKLHTQEPGDTLSCWRKSHAIPAKARKH